jgi:cytoskeletal protein RodZ
MRTRLITCSLAIGVLLVVAGCNKTGGSNSSMPATSSSAPASPDATSATNSPGYPSGQAGSTPQPANSPAGQAAAPAPVPQAPPPIVIRQGTVLTVTIDQSVSTKDNSAGDRFAASLAEPVSVDGVEALPSGTRATGTVTQAQSAGHVKGGALLALTLDSVTVHGQKYSVETSSFEEAGKGRGKRTAIGAGGGAAFGAIIGALAGGGKGAAIGALAGGGAGTAGTAFTGKRDFTVPAETRLHFKLERSLTIHR